MAESVGDVIVLMRHMGTEEMLTSSLPQPSPRPGHGPGLSAPFTIPPPQPPGPPSDPPSWGCGPWRHSQPELGAAAGGATHSATRLSFCRWSPSPKRWIVSARPIFSLDAPTVVSGHGGDVSSVPVRDSPPPPPCPPGPLSYQGSVATGHTYGRAKGAQKICPFCWGPPRMQGLGSDQLVL